MTKVNQERNYSKHYAENARLTHTEQKVRLNKFLFDKNYGLAHWSQPAPVLPRAVVHTSNPATLTVIRSDDRTGFSVCHRWIEKEQ